MTKLFGFFAGKYVSIIMKSAKGSQQLSDGAVIEGNVILEGYLLDEDDKFYYLGKEQEEIDDALDKSDVIRIYIGDEKEVFTEFDVDDLGGERH
jgi:hypothetical protein